MEAHRVWFDGGIFHVRLPGESVFSKIRVSLHSLPGRDVCFASLFRGRSTTCSLILVKAARTQEASLLDSVASCVSVMLFNTGVSVGFS